MNTDNIETLIPRIIQSTTDAMMQTHNMAGANAVFNQCLGEGLRQILAAVTDEVQEAVHCHSSIQGWQYLGMPTIKAYKPVSGSRQSLPKVQSIDQALKGKWMC